MNKQLRIFCIGCTHSFHGMINIPENIDMIIHTGDESNYRNAIMNERECRDFLEWFSTRDVKYKIFVAGNHSSAIYEKLITKNEIETMGINYLENDFVVIEGLHIHGTPHTPNFNDWCFMKDRGKMDQVWSNVSENVDILVSHGPARYILDLAYDRSGRLEFCGDKSLFTHIKKEIFKPKLCVHSHIHDNEDVTNYGTRQFNETLFANVAMVKDGQFSRGITHGGIVFNIDLETKQIVKTEIL